MSTSSVSRDELYELVWSEPMTRAAVRFGVSSSFLARVCARLNVPRPPRGYWAKLTVGKAPPKPGLPEPGPGDELVWTRGSAPTRQLPRTLPKPPEKATPPATTARFRSRARHSLVDGVRRFFVGAKEAESGHLRPTKRRVVDLYVSSAVLGRSLALANNLFLALEANGHRVTLAPFTQQLRRLAVDERIEGGRRDDHSYGRWSPDRPTVVYIGTVAIGLSLFEMSEEVEMRRADGKYVRVRRGPTTHRASRDVWNTWTIKRHTASGRLCLRASSPFLVAQWERQWRETKKGELSSLIPKIVEELTAAAVTVARLVEEGERLAEEQRRQWQLQHERWEREKEDRRRSENVKESREHLAEIIAAWGAAKQVEAFFEDAARRAGGLADNERQAFLDRVNRARELLGGTDAVERLAEWESPEERNGVGRGRG